MNSSIVRPGALLLALGMAFGLSACNKDNAQTAAPAASGSAGGASEGSQSITINNGAEPESLDPHKVSGVPESHLLTQLLEGLTSTDKDGNTAPGMAESWESADNQVWIFKLRDAKWSDGSPVTAEDFVYSLRRLVDPKTGSPYASYLDDAHVLNAGDVMNGKKAPDTLGVKAVDERTLEITLSQPVPYFPDMLVHTSVKPVNKKAVEQHGDKWTSPENFVSNGPYKLKSWEVNSQIVLERNPGYYDNANTKIDRAVFLPISSPPTDVNRYKAGEVDFTYNDLPSDQFQTLKKEMGEEMKTSPLLCVYYYETNTVKPPFDDVRVRRALALALDRDTFAEKVVGRGETAAYQFTPTATQGIVPNKPEWAGWSQEQRVAEAKKLLTEAGYSEAKPLSFDLLYNTNENHKKNAVAAAALWKQTLGFVNVNLANQEWKTYLESRRSGKYQMARAGWCADYNEPSSFLNILKTGNSNNHGKYSSAEFDRLMAETLKPGISTEQRADLYRQAEAVLDKDMPNINVYHYANVRLVKPYVEGYSVKDPMDNFHLKYMSVAKH
ncbi:peptide ABC transporter substrate-binding protein [Neisseria arctica]|uniref:Peptide ABC transporter substrate-binding protein n=1 Tax=Neisseria arctica TaxID=1470200 RepID=A0A0J0YRW2_9NEIS|nr:ABC transporter substrate-binding protein [Neisseria arctica]KLT72837.1 peptide ABC transporter substrate-binding protein [Neisseria arctica]UOO86549.1 ABC transporter substrate-binding protein [Neisseria arctica]